MILKGFFVYIFQSAIMDESDNSQFETEDFYNALSSSHLDTTDIESQHPWSTKAKNVREWQQVRPLPLRTIQLSK